MTIALSTATQNAAADAVVDLVDVSGPGSIEIRTTPRPATANDAVSGTLLATVVLVNPAFGAAATGTAALTDPPAVTAAADGQAAWFRILDGAAATVMDGDVTATGGGGDLTLNTVTISTGLDVDITGGTVSMPAGT